MATKLLSYRPIMPGNDPISATPVTTFSAERYKMFESGGDVFVFATGRDPQSNKEVTRCSRFCAHGTMTLDLDASALLKKFEKE